MSPFDKGDRLSRPKFLKKLGFDETTEAHALKERLPWPPYVVIGARRYYSTMLTDQWLQQHTVRAEQNGGHGDG